MMGKGLEAEIQSAHWDLVSSISPGRFIAVLLFSTSRDVLVVHLLFGIDKGRLEWRDVWD